jgi:hypothetical protein
MKFTKEKLEKALTELLSQEINVKFFTLKT